MAKIGNSHLDVSALNLGGNVFGWTADQQQSFAVLDAFVEAGGNFVDTADIYTAPVPGNSGGESETIIGNWMAARGNRQDIVVGTKVGQLTGGNSRKAIQAGIEGSLRRLRTDYIDLYYIHDDHPATPVSETLTVLDELVRDGKVRYIAASNFGPERLTESLEFSDRERLAKYVALQPHYNLVHRDMYETDLRPVVEAYGLSVFPYFALASGFLTGKHRPGNAADSARTGIVADYLTSPRALSALAALDNISAARGVPQSTIAIAWLAAQPTVTAPIASARTPEQLAALLDGVKLTLTDEELAMLDKASV